MNHLPVPVPRIIRPTEPLEPLRHECPKLAPTPPALKLVSIGQITLVVDVSDVEEETRYSRPEFLSGAWLLVEEHCGWRFG